MFINSLYAGDAVVANPQAQPIQTQQQATQRQTEQQIQTEQTQIEEEDRIEERNMSRYIWFIGIKAGIGMTEAGDNGNANVYNRTYTFGTRLAFFFPVKSTYLKIGAITDFTWERRTTTNNDYDYFSRASSYYDYLEPALLLAIIIRGIYAGAGASYAMLAKDTELPSYMLAREPYFVSTIGYMIEISPYIKILIGFDIKVALFETDVIGRRYPYFTLSSEKKRPVGFTFNVGVGW